MFRQPCLSLYLEFPGFHFEFSMIKRKVNDMTERQKSSSYGIMFAITVNQN